MSYDYDRPSNNFVHSGVVYSRAHATPHSSFSKKSNEIYKSHKSLNVQNNIPGTFGRRILPDIFLHKKSSNNEKHYFQYPI